MAWEFEEGEVTQMQDTFSSRLTRLMKEHGDSHAEIGRVVGVSGQAVGKWARGGNIEYDNLRALAQHFNVNWIWLRYGDDAMQSFSERRTGSKARRAVIKDIMENEERMRLALGAAQIGTWDLELVTDQLVMSQEARLLLGISPQATALNRSDLLKCMVEAERADLAEVLEQLLESQRESFDISQQPIERGSRVRLRGQVVKDEAGRPIRVVGLVNLG